MFLAPWRVRRWRGILAVVLATPLLALAVVFWQASRAKEESTSEVLSKSQFPIRVIPVDRAVPAAVEPIAASPAFRDLARYKEMIAVSARAGLFLYDRNGALIRSYRAGIELPPAELGSMSVGIAAGSAEPELFIATHGEGLLAFDGARFRQILPADSGLRIVTSMLVLGSGRVLLGTQRQGLLVFDGRRLAPFHPRLNTAHVTALAGSEGSLWIGTLENGVFHYRAGQLEELLSALPDPQVLSLTVQDEMAYVGTPLGVVEFRDGQRQRTLADGFFARALSRRGATLHVGTEDEGIVDVPLQSRPMPPAAVPLDSDAPPVPILRLANVEGDVYAVGESAIYRYDAASKRWRPVLTAGGAVMADRNVAAVALSAGRLWIGYFDRGLDVVDAGFERAVHHEDDALFCINRIVADEEHARTAVATANGLVLFDSAGQPRQAMGRKDGFLSDHVTDVAFRDGNRGGGMVVATAAGLSFVDRSGVRSLYVFHGLVNNHVYTVATRGAETVAGTLGGVSVLDDDTVRANYTTANSHLKHNWITALARVGDEWFAGTYGAGVLRLDGSGEWRSFPDLKEGFVVNPNAMAASGGQVYAGSLDRGLFIFDRASGRWRNTTVGLPSKNVTALAAGGGYLYVGTDNGLVRIAEGALR
jgi:ligand-binding sensor domain-containing protein